MEAKAVLCECVCDFVRRWSVNDNNKIIKYIKRKKRNRTHTSTQINTYQQSLTSPQTSYPPTTSTGRSTQPPGSARPTPKSAGHILEGLRASTIVFEWCPAHHAAAWRLCLRRSGKQTRHVWRSPAHCRSFRGWRVCGCVCGGVRLKRRQRQRQRCHHRQLRQGEKGWGVRRWRAIFCCCWRSRRRWSHGCGCEWWWWWCVCICNMCVCVC